MRGELQHELDDLSERLDEAGGATQAQVRQELATNLLSARKSINNLVYNEAHIYKYLLSLFSEVRDHSRLSMYVITLHLCNLAFNG